MFFSDLIDGVFEVEDVIRFRFDDSVFTFYFFLEDVLIAFEGFIFAHEINLFSLVFEYLCLKDSFYLVEMFLFLLQLSFVVLGQLFDLFVEVFNAFLVFLFLFVQFSAGILDLNCLL